MFVRLSVGVLVPSHALVFIHTSACLFGIFSTHVRRAIKSASDLFFFYVSLYLFPTMIANDTQNPGSYKCPCLQANPISYAC